MNYPFTKSNAMRRVVSLSLVLLMTGTVLTGCFKKEVEAPTEPSLDLPNLVDTGETTESTEPQQTVPDVTEAAEPEEENIATVKEQLNVRSSPSSGSNVNAQLDAGEKVKVLRIEPVNGVQWAYINSVSDGGAKGWVTADLLDMSSVSLTPNGTTDTPAATGEASNEEGTKPTEGGSTSTGKTMGVVTANDLNVRKEASKDSDRIGGVSYGDRVTITETKNGFGKIKQGWISMDYVYVDGNTGKNTCSGTITASQLIVRSGPGTTYEQVSSLNNGARVDVLEQVKVGGKVWGCIKGGWICMDYVSATTGSILGGGTNNTPAPNPTPNPNPAGPGTGTVTATNLNIRSGAGKSFPSVGGLKQGDVVTVTETAVADGMTWGKIAQGWICMDYVKMN